MRRILDGTFTFGLSLTFGTAIGICIGLIVSMNKIDDKVQRLQSEVALYKLRAEEKCYCAETKIPVPTNFYKETEI